MKPRYFVCDFETTVFEQQEYTEVWAFAIVEMFTDNVMIFHSLEEGFDYLRSLNQNVILYFHNLKFDGSFWLDFLLIQKHYKQSYVQIGEDVNTLRFNAKKDMKNNEFTYSISNLGQWYRILIKTNKHFIEIRDSLKLLPFSVKKIGNSFGTKHKKLELQYEGIRYAGCEITPEEQEYIKNDVLVVKEALEIMFEENHKKLTIGSCCLSEYKKSIGFNAYKAYYPNLYNVIIEPKIYGVDNAGEYIRRSYRGGWCYLVKGKENRLYKNGVTADVNSLYPSMMSSESGNIYPIGSPTFWSGNYIPDEAYQKFYFVRIKTRFYLKQGKLPTIQIKSSLLYKATEMLETSDVYYNGKYYKYVLDSNHQQVPTRVELTLTMMDFELMKEHYNLVDFEILDGCYFDQAIGIFDDYIEKYKKIKMENKGAKRELAKLFLNNLYGKMASSTHSDFKVAYEKEDHTIGFFQVLADEKVPGYIPVGSAITSYARCFTIRAAQANYHGKEKPGFIYADTDSMHCDLSESQLQGIKIHPKNFNCWDIESHWDEGLFIRQKTYLEVENGKYNLKCAGMPDNCKELFISSITGHTVKDNTGKPKKLTQEEKEFLSVKRTIYDLKSGLKIPGKLLPKRIKGGIVLKETTYEIK